MLVEANYDGAFKQASWRISPDGRVKLNYTYAYDGAVDLLGVNFDFPEADMKGITWLGYGPYHVWQNRLQGTRLDVWHNAYNNTVPSVIYSFNPEFKGYFRDWRWATFDTAKANSLSAPPRPNPIWESIIPTTARWDRCSPCPRPAWLSWMSSRRCATNF